MLYLEGRAISLYHSFQVLAEGTMFVGCKTKQSSPQLNHSSMSTSCTTLHRAKNAKPNSLNPTPPPPPPQKKRKLSTSSIPTLGTLLREKCNVSMRPQIVFFAALQLRCKTIEVLALQGQMLWGSALQGLGRTRTLCH